MGVSSKIVRGQSTPQGKPTAPMKGPSQTAKIVTPKSKGGKGGC